MKIFEMITYSTVQIKVECMDGSRASGTGFILGTCQKENGQYIPLLVTNNHVVRNAKTVLVTFCKADDKGDPIDTKKFTIAYDGMGFISHPNPNVDLCFIGIGRDLQKLKDNGYPLFFIPIPTAIIPNEEKLNN